MDIGLLKEIKSSEHRVLLIPDAIEKLVSLGNNLFVESGAGKDSGFEDKEYEGAGAQILPSSEKIFQKVELILKIQPPMPIEYELFTAKYITAGSHIKVVPITGINDNIAVTHAHKSGMFKPNTVKAMPTTNPCNIIINKFPASRTFITLFSLLTTFFSISLGKGSAL